MTDEQANTNAPKPARGWFQFRLRTLFIVTTVCALVLGMATVPYQRRAFEEKLRRELGGPAPFYVDRNGVPWWSARARRVVFHSEISDLKMLYPMRGFLDDDQLARVQPLLTSVESLDLSSTQVTDVGMKHVGKMTQLTNVNLSATAISDAGLHYLEHLSKLQYLNLVGTEVTNEGLARVRKALPNTKVWQGRLRYPNTECHAGIPPTRRP